MCGYKTTFLFNTSLKLENHLLLWYVIYEKFEHVGTTGSVFLPRAVGYDPQLDPKAGLFFLMYPVGPILLVCFPSRGSDSNTQGNTFNFVFIELYPGLKLSRLSKVTEIDFDFNCSFSFSATRAIAILCSSVLYIGTIAT